MNSPSLHNSPVTFKARIQDAEFPCIGAKSALSRGNLHFFEAGDLRSAAFDADIVRRLQALAHDTPVDAVFVSQVVRFRRTPPLTELQFEQQLWQRLQALHALDARTHGWDPRVSADPRSPHFSLSIGGRGFYVVGLHPQSSREARRFPCPALVFNLHSQFETLRSDGRYQKLRDTILERDLAYSGSPNPMLAQHGEASEARQYSGRQVGEDWGCPFKPHDSGQRHRAA